MLPKQKEIEAPLLEVLAEMGGQGKASDIYPLVRRKFPQIREEDLAETLPSGANKWINAIQWARQHLVNRGEMDSPAYGIWRITTKGRQCLEEYRPAVSKTELARPTPTLVELKDKQINAGRDTLEESTPTFLELHEEYELLFRAQALGQLHDLSPQDFEQFARKLLMAYGFVDVKVTQLSRDGGIDGYGKLRLGLATMNVAFQCKRWQGNIGRPEVDKFRGAIQGEFEQGVFFTTSDFTPEARDASLKKGAVPVILLNGESIVDLMIEKGLGVERVPLYAYYMRPSDLTEKEK